MFACVSDKTQPEKSPLTALFNMPQTDPNIEGYIGEISDDDPRIEAFSNPQPT